MLTTKMHKLYYKVWSLTRQRIFVLRPLRDVLIEFYKFFLHSLPERSQDNDRFQEEQHFYRRKAGL